jgi:hypothetical protein
MAKALAGSQPFSTPTTLAPIRASLSAPAAQRWKSAVEAALADEGSQLRIDNLVPNEYPPFGVAAISEIGFGRVVFGLQTFADGEFRSDANWQMEVAGSTKRGLTIPEGTLFEFDEQGTGVRDVTIVAPVGIVSVHAESVPAADLPSTVGLRSIAQALVRSANADADMTP